MFQKTWFASIIIILIMCSGLLSTTSMVFNKTPSTTDVANSASIIVKDLIDNPKMDQEPGVVINGTSSEFSYDYHHSTNEPDNSYVELTWTHTAGTKLDYKWIDSGTGQDPEGILPDYNDFIYTYQEFEWLYEQRPIDAQIFFNFSTFRTGDFAAGAQPLNNLMFRLYAWVIDSSGNWIRVYESREATYTENYTLKKADLNYFELVDIFDGMVEEDGTQEDPTDTARLLFGLAPFFRFEHYLGTEPWTDYNGSVSVRLDFMNFYTFVDVEGDTSLTLQPEYNNTYATTIGDVFPNSPSADEDVWDSCRGVAVGKDGSVYVTGDSQSTYDLYVEEGLYFDHQFLLKYSPSLELLWKVENSNRTRVKDIVFNNGYIYTTGYNRTDDEARNLILTKWNPKGEIVWQSEWGEFGEQVGVGVGVHLDGTIYVIASDYSNAQPPFYDNSSLLEFDSNGNLLQNNSIDLCTFYDLGGRLYVGYNVLYFYLTSYTLVSMDLEGNFHSRFPSEAAAPDGEGGVYIANSIPIPEELDSSQIVITHTDSSGYEIENYTYSRVWPNGIYYYYRPVSMILTKINTIQLLAYNYYLAYDFTLLDFDLEGNLLSNRTIGNDYWPWTGGGPMYMEDGNSGVVYFAFTSMLMDTWVQGYATYNIPTTFQVSWTTIIAIASASVIIVAVAGIALSKRRQSF